MFIIMELRKRKLPDREEGPRKAARRELAALPDDALDINKSLSRDEHTLLAGIRHYKDISLFANGLKLSQQAIDASGEVLTAVESVRDALANLHDRSDELFYATARI